MVPGPLNPRRPSRRAARPRAIEPRPAGDEPDTRPGDASDGDAGAGPAGARRGPPDIPGYRIHGVIGRGSTGVVYRATQLAVDREVALKVLHPELVGTRAVRRLQREARTTARLAHPCIVSAIDMGQVGGLWWYAMELVEGKSLARILQERGRIGEREALRLFTPLCEALHHAWQNGVVHRDIKPGNVLVGTDRRARLVDLGLAFAEDDPMLTRTGGTLGTPNYISPEQARDPSAADVRSDIWSFGATLFHAVCGRPPFHGESVAEILSGVLYARVPDPHALEPRLSKGLVLVLRKCLARDPDRRYQEPLELLADLERLRERRGVHVRAQGLDPLQGQASRGLRLAIGLGVVALGLGVWTLLELRGQPSSPPAAEERVDLYGPLEDLAAELRGGGAPGAVLARLERLEEEVPPDSRARFDVVRAEAHRAYNAALAGARREVQQRLDELVLVQRDWRGALEYLDGGLERELAGRLAPSPSRLRAELDSDWVREHEQRVEQGLTAAVANLQRALEAHLRDVLLPRVEVARSRHAWREALAELRRDPRAWIAASGAGAERLPDERVETVLADLRERAAAERAALEEAWRELDQRLAREVGVAAQDVERRLEEREPVSDAAALLAERFERRLGEIGLAPDQALLEVSRSAWDELELAGRELEDHRRALLARDGELWFGRRDVELAGLRSARRYDDLAAAWRAGLELGWLEDLQERVELRARAADVLQGFLTRAAQRVRELDGQRATFYVGNIAASGEVRAGVDPLERGFVLRTRAGDEVEHALALRAGRAGQAGAPALRAGEQLVRATDVEDLARGGTEERRAALERALFRFYEGDVAAAEQVLRGEPLPVREDARLVEDLMRRVRESRSTLEGEAERRLAEARELYVLVQRERAHETDVEGALRRIDELLRSYLDLAWVKERESELRALRRQWTSPPSATTRADFEQHFAPDELDLSPLGRVRMRWDLRGPSGGKWSRGDWRPDGGGWSASVPRTGEDLFLDTRWPRLQLRPPLEVDVPGIVEATFEVEQLQGSGPPRLLVLTVAGIHVAFAGAEGGFPPRLAITSGREGLRTMLRDVMAGGGEPLAQGLVRGERHSIRVALSRGRGRASVSLDGRELAARTLPAPSAGDAGSSSLAVRSLEPVRLVSVTLEGTYE